jgi:hypothetical protein
MFLKLFCFYLRIPRYSYCHRLHRFDLKENDFFCHFVLKQSNQNSRKNDATARKATSARSRYATGQAVFSGPRSVNASHLLDGGGSI